MNKTANSFLALAAGSLCLALISFNEARGEAASAPKGHDWPQWGGANTRNMVSDEKGMPTTFNPGKKKAGSEEIDMSTTQNCLWAAKLGSQTYGTPTVAEGRVYVGTNNESPRSPKHQGDRGVVMCFDEKTGSFKWQLIAPKLGAGKVSDWEFLGMCSSPTVVGDKGYVVTNRCEILCFDVKGMEDGNQGMQDESKYMAAPDKDGKITPVEIDSTDADILWTFDMRKELGVLPHNISSNYPLVVDGKVYVATSNGVDWSHSNIPAPTAPSFVCVDAETGKYEAEIPADAKISENIMHCNWSSPSMATVNGKQEIIFCAGDGFVYGLGTAAEKKKVDSDVSELPILWKYDAVPKEYRLDDKGEKRKYSDYDGPSELIATPVEADGLLYMVIGQDPEHGEGVGQLSCIDPANGGKVVWTFKQIERSISTPAVKDGLVYASDYTGRLFCLDAKTGKLYWKFDTKGHIWSSPLVVDGKIYLGNEEGDMYILAEGKEMKQLGKVEFPAPVMGTPVAANGILFLATHTHLYAFKDGAKPVQQ